MYSEPSLLVHVLNMLGHSQASQQGNMHDLITGHNSIYQQILTGTRSAVDKPMLTFCHCFSFTSDETFSVRISKYLKHSVIMADLYYMRQLTLDFI